MKLTIHRGSNQIGGCITEYELEGWKLFVDFGEQLPGSPKSDSPLRIEGLNCGDTSRSALLITHYHGDHIGNLSEAHPSIPVYMGKDACKIFSTLQQKLTSIKGLEGEKAKDTLERCHKAQTFADGEILEFGPFEITPVRMDHSAFDAYGFIIGNKSNPEDKVFHTGDFRAHGSCGSKFYETIKALPALKAIVCEGTNIERGDTPAEPEYAVEGRFGKLFRENKYNVVYVSSTNIDRLYAILRAAKAAGRPLLMDGYQFDILKSVSTNYGYEFNKSSEFELKFDRMSKLQPRFYIPYKLRRFINWKGCVLLARTTRQYNSLVKTFPKGKTKMYLSMWKGYVNPENPAYNADLAKAAGVDYEYVHTSGHADRQSLEHLFINVDARMIIPMHTDNPEEFIKKFPSDLGRIRLLKDGEPLSL